MLKLREATNDLMVWKEVFIENEYRLPDRMDGMSVIDVGAHIGTFALACLCREALWVDAFESDPQNQELFALAFANLSANCDCAAVWRSDLGEGAPFIKVGPHPYLLTNPAAGGAFVPHPSIEVRAIGLDVIIGRYIPGQIHLLKLDCEGSEYPILLTSKRLGEIPAICGEWHTIDPSVSDPFGLGEWSPYRLRDHLTDLGYTCEFVLQSDYPFQGLFWAWKGSSPFKPRRTQP